MRINIVLLMKNFSDFITDDYTNQFNEKSKVNFLLTDKLDNIILKNNWDLIIPLNIPINFEQDFDSKIREHYSTNFPNLDGVLLLQNEDESITIPVIGKNYVKDFGYIYNPIYSTQVAEKEFLDVLKLKQKFVIIKDILFNRVEIITNDDKVYEFRKKFNFGIYDVEKLKARKRKKQAKPNLFNSLVDETYVINLERRKDRMEHMELQMSNLEISYRRFNAIDGLKIKGETILSKGALGAFRSHLGVIKDAIENGHQKIAVFEDDIIFCDDFYDRLKIYLDNLPNNWDIMYLGCHFNSCNNPTLLKNNVYKVKDSYGCFSMILNNQNGLFKKIIENPSELIPYDDYIKKIQPNLNCYVFMPFFVKTMNTTSDIGERKGSFEYEVVNKHFAKILKPEDIKPEPQKPKFQQPVQEHISTNNNQYVCEDYLRTNAPFVIYFNGRLLFDSTTTDKMNLRFERDHFTLYGKVFPYQGMMIKRK